MKSLLLSIFLFALTTLNAQETNPLQQPGDTVTLYKLKLKDNSLFTGKIIERTAKEVIFEDVNIGKFTVPLLNIISLTKLENPQSWVIQTHDGKSFTGTLVSRDEQQIVIQTDNLGTLTIQNSKIKEIKLIDKTQVVDGRYYFTNPHPTRYFFGPSAIPLKKGEGYYQNAYIFANSAQIGVDDHFSFGGGIVIPFIFFITPKFGFQVSEKVYLGGGVLAASTISSDIPFGIAIGYGTLTVGNVENSFTINAGWGSVREEYEEYDPVTMSYDYHDGWQLAKKPMFSFSGMTRVSPRMALITENWVFSSRQYEYDMNGLNTNITYKYQAVLSLGFRLMWEKHSFDMALAIPAIDDVVIGLPYIDYVYKF